MGSLYICNYHCHAVYVQGSSMELQCFEIETEGDNNDDNECLYDDGTSTGMFAVSLSPF